MHAEGLSQEVATGSVTRSRWVRPLLLWLLPLLVVAVGVYWYGSGGRYATTDTSKNSLLLALITLGEGWHNNHHYYQSTANQGFFWWEIDVSLIFLGAVLFGARNYGRVVGLMSPVMRPRVGIGPPFAGWSYDVSGDYVLAFTVFVVLMVAALLALARVRLPRIGVAAAR